MTEATTSTELRTCTLCGATVLPNTRTCEFCGNILPLPEEHSPPVASVQQDSYLFEAAIAAILLVSSIYILLVIGKTHPMLHPFFRLVIAWAVTSFMLAIAILLDSNRLRSAGNNAAGTAKLSPEQWFIATLPAWPVALPLYCAVRRPERGRAYLYGWIAIVVLFVSIVLFTTRMLSRESDRFYPPASYRRPGTVK